MSLAKIELERFTAFSNLKPTLSPGINVLVGANGTGKTHLMKVRYAATDVSKTGTSFTEKLIRVFLPSDLALGRLVKRQNVSTRSVITVRRDDGKLRTSFSNHVTARSPTGLTRANRRWTSRPMERVYIPVKEMLSNAPGCLSLYAARELHFEEVYNDILHRASRPLLRGTPDALHKQRQRAA